MALLQSLLERIYIDSHILILNSKSTKEMTKREDIWGGGAKYYLYGRKSYIREWGMCVRTHIFLGPDSQNLILFPSLSLAVMETDLPNELGLYPSAYGVTRSSQEH